ncbi:MAG TPA: elongation factor Ts [Actinomycetota bacterium]|nr:elongation factor Ts [Actinomycetota bacterium]
MMDCKRALTESAGDLARAKELLRTWGLADNQKRSGRTASEGLVSAYIHEVGGLPPKVGVLIELDCETDFVAKTPEFRELARNLAMQVAASEPKWVRREDVPVDFIEAERAIARNSDAVKNKPEQVVDKIVDGRVKAVLEGKGGVLLMQPYIKDSTGKQKVEDLVGEVAATMKENIVVRRFSRFKVGEADEAGPDPGAGGE